MELEDLYNDEPRDSSEPPKHAPAKIKVEVSAQEALAITVSRVVLGLILLVSFAVGCWVAATALTHPDTCWFLALGRWIYEHGAVPDLEPFSWVPAAQSSAGNLFVVDQWLSALVSYLSTLSGGLLTLLMLNAVVIVTAFLSLPIGFVVRRGAPFVAGLALVLMAMLTAFLCPASCAEIFSYLFLAIFLQVVHHARTALLWHDEKVFRIAYVLVPLMVLWANMHIGFVAGLLILLGCLVGESLGSPKQQPNRSLKIELTLALVGSLAASFATPYGWKIWATIPALCLSLVTGSDDSVNIGNFLGFSLSAPVAFSSYAYWPYALLCCTFVFLAFRGFRTFKSKQANVSASTFVDVLVFTETVTASVIGCFAVALGLCLPTLMIFTTLVLLSEVLALLGLRRLANHAETALQAAAAESESTTAIDATATAITATAKPTRTFWQDLNFHSLDVWLAGGAFELAIVSFCSIAGVCLVANKIVKPQLPATKVSFSKLLASPTTAYASGQASTPAATQALIYIEKHKSELSGRVFNDASFGDLLDWQLRATPKVFIDTRPRVYSEKIVEDYRTILCCLKGWQGLVWAYKIDWVFVKPGASIALELQNNPAWETRYRNDSAVIFARKGI